jgi:hypothetical protein
MMSVVELDRLSSCANRLKYRIDPTGCGLTPQGESQRDETWFLRLSMSDSEAAVDHPHETTSNTASVRRDIAAAVMPTRRGEGLGVEGRAVNP